MNEFCKRRRAVATLIVTCLLLTGGCVASKSSDGGSTESDPTSSQKRNSVWEIPEKSFRPVQRGLDSTSAGFVPLERYIVTAMDPSRPTQYGERSPSHGRLAITWLERTTGLIRSFDFQSDDNFQQNAQKPWFSAATIDGNDLVALKSSSITDRSGIVPASAERLIELWGIGEKSSRKWSVPVTGLPNVTSGVLLDGTEDYDLEMTGITKSCVLIFTSRTESVSITKSALTCLSIADGQQSWSISNPGESFNILGTGHIAAKRGTSVIVIDEHTGKEVATRANVDWMYASSRDPNLVVKLNSERANGTNANTLLVVSPVGTELGRLAGVTTTPVVETYRHVVLGESTAEGIAALSMKDGSRLWSIPARLVNTIVGPSLGFGVLATSGSILFAVGGQRATIDALTGRQIGVDIATASTRWRGGLDAYDGSIWITPLEDGRIVGVPSKAVPVALVYRNGDWMAMNVEDFS